MLAPLQMFISMSLPASLALLLAALLGWLLSGQLGRLGLLDHPNERSSHKRSTPRGGGLAFIIAALLVLPFGDGAGLATASSIQVGFALLLIPLPLALIGLLDDRLGLPVGLRLIVQLLTAAGLAVVAGLPLPLALVALLPGVAVINAINFMDGLDGLVASCLAIWVFLAAVLLELPGLGPLAAGLVGFLFWNWSPAKLFMGDVGSTYLGAVMAGGLLIAAEQFPPQVSLGLLLAGLPLLGDAFICLFRRMLAGQRLWQAHRLHLYQRLHQAGWSHQRVAALYMVTTAVLAGLALGMQGLPQDVSFGLAASSAVLTFALGYQLDRHVAVAFTVSPNH